MCPIYPYIGYSIIDETLKKLSPPNIDGRKFQAGRSDHQGAGRLTSQHWPHPRKADAGEMRSAGLGRTVYPHVAETGLYRRRNFEASTWMSDVLVSTYVCTIAKKKRFNSGH